jgi:hypothetical protein
MTWDLMLFSVHFLATIAAIWLCVKAPCWMQQLVMVGLTISMALSSVGYIGKGLDTWWGPYILLAGLVIGHICNLLLIFRLVHQAPAWNQSSRPSQHSQV